MEVSKILSNLRMPKRWECFGLSGATIYAQSFSEFVSNLRESDLVVVNGLEATLRLCTLFTLAPILRRPLVAVDVILRRPDSPRSLLSALVIRHLLQRVDYFLHYFRDLSGYEKYFGIVPGRSGYVSFKPNLRYRAEIKPNPDGEYVLSIGQSMRDYETFFEAVGTLPYPAAITVPDFRELRRGRSRFTRSLNELPGNVSLLTDDRSQDSLVRILRGAKLIVLPILKSSLCASGISLYLNSMLLGKCVLISKGPGASDVLTDEAILVNPEDPGALAHAIRRAWEDETLRRKTAAAGHAYALSLGGEPELCQRILETAVRWYSHSANHRESKLITRYS